MSNSFILRNGTKVFDFKTFKGDFAYIAYQCGQIPFEGYIFKTNIEYTIKNGAIEQNLEKLMKKN